METFATPALVIDLAVVERNLARMAGYVKQHGLSLRPHTKTHKSLFMARRQLEHGGATGLTVAKAGEAEVMAQASPELYLAYPALDRPRLRKLADLARRGVNLRVGLDSAFAADAFAEAARAAGVTFGVLVDLDVGYHRTGVPTPHAALELARHVASRRGLRLDGLMLYPGHLMHAQDLDKELAAVQALAAETLALWKQSGLEARVVSGGSTPTAFVTHKLPAVTEIRPGTYIYNDMNTVDGKLCGLDDCAARVAVTVISNAVAGKVVLDGGSKTFTSDRNACRADAGFGHVVEYPEAKIVRLSEEHAEVDIAGCARAPQLGERLHVIPNHICPCVNLQEQVWLKRGPDDLVPLEIEARARLS